MAKKIGFIGLGTMGKPMAKNLLKADFAVTGYDINKDAVKDVEKAGGRGAGSPKEVAAQSDVIITMLPDSPDVENVYGARRAEFHGLCPWASTAEEFAQFA
jgi:3-hydroxyisobutyrate dehydrogenase-like beta-hydroxyacid dehydrogenase